MSDHEADGPALAGFVTLQKERLQSLTRLQQNYKKDSPSRKTESYYMKRLQQIECLIKYHLHRGICQHGLSR